WIVFARFVDRVGKGIRGAPRDALIADITPPHLRGAAYGLRQALDTLGAVAGPLLAIAAMLWLADDFRTVFWLATIPAFAPVVLVSYPAGIQADRGRHRGLLLAGLLALVVADLILARASSIAVVLIGAAVWGVHMGLTQGVLAAMVAETSPAELRGTAFGFFNL